MDTIKDLGLDIESAKKMTLSLATPKNIALATAGVGLTYISYRTLSIYLKRRKYRHIPGPSTKG